MIFKIKTNPSQAPPSEVAKVTLFSEKTLKVPNG